MFNQALASHILGLVKTHSIQDRRSNISKCTWMIPPANLERIPLLPSLRHDKWNVCSLQLAPHATCDIQYEQYEGSSHHPKSSSRHFYPYLTKRKSLPVICCHKENIAEFLAGFIDGPDGLVTMSHCLDSSLVNTCMSDHIGICEIKNDKGVFSGFEHFNSLVCDAVDTHFSIISMV